MNELQKIQKIQELVLNTKKLLQANIQLGNTGIKQFTDLNKYKHITFKASKN